MRYALLAATLALLPLTVSAKDLLGTLHRGATVIIFNLAGNTVVIEERDAGGARDDLQVPVKDMGCTGVGTDHTLTLKANGLKMRRDQVARGDLVYFNFQKSGSRTWVFNRDEDAAAFALAAKLNRLAHCK
jgi:hypothetical protein